MKYLLNLIVLILMAICVNAQNEKPGYDKALADSLGADDYGMKMYVLVMLKTGANTGLDKPATDSLFRGHMNNMGVLVKQGKLVVAGPIAKNDKNYRGIFILNVKTIDEAKTLLATDPAVAAGILDADLFNWYGSAALATYLPNHEKLEKKKH